MKSYIKGITVLAALMIFFCAATAHAGDAAPELRFEPEGGGKFIYGNNPGGDRFAYFNER